MFAGCGGPWWDVSRRALNLMEAILGTYYKCILSAVPHKLNICGHMLIWTLFVFVLVCGTRAQNLSAPFSYRIYSFLVVYVKAVNDEPLIVHRPIFSMKQFKVFYEHCAGKVVYLCIKIQTPGTWKIVNWVWKLKYTAESYPGRHSLQFIWNTALGYPYFLAPQSKEIPWEKQEPTDT
jgi:hypothetical protein